MNVNRLVKITAVLFLCTAFIVAFSHLGTVAVNQFLQPEGAFSEGTKIGNIDVSGKTPLQAEQQLAAEVEQWKANSALTVQLVEDSHEINLSELHIDLQESVDIAEQGANNPVKIQLTDQVFSDMFLSPFPEMDANEFNLEPLKAELMSIANLTTPIVQTIQLVNYLKDAEADTIAEAELARIDITPGIVTLIDHVPEIEVNGKSQISLLAILEEKGMDEAVSEDISIIASLLYELMFQTNFTIMERNQSSELPKYAELGLEAKVDVDSNKDFIFANPNDQMYRIVFTRSQNGVQAELKGIPFAFHYQLTLQNQKSFSPKVIQQYSAAVAEGAVSMTEQGKDGMMITSYREKFDKLGNKLGEEWIAEDFYPPTHRIEVRSLLQKEVVMNDSGVEDNAPSGNESIDYGQPGSGSKNELGGAVSGAGSANKDDGNDSNSTSGSDPSSPTDPPTIWTDPGDIKK